MSNNSYVVNPTTSRPIKVGSRAYLKLVKEGVFDPDQGEDVQTNPDVVEEAKTPKKKTGTYAKKIEERKTKPKAKKAKAKPKPTPVQSESESESDYDQLEKDIERMIMDELRIHKKAKADKPKVKKVAEKVPPKKRGRPKKVIEEDEDDFEVEVEVEEEDESETDEETDEDSD